MTENLRDRLTRVPRRTGVYLLTDRRERIIYIGKAVDLRARLRSHLTGASASPWAGPIAEQVRGFDFIPCGSEAEALILEQTLIKEHRPRFNIDLKDDKRYPYLKLTEEEYPRVFKTREVDDDGATYFGPYTSASAMESMLDSLLAIFPLRTCSYEIPFRDPNARECLEYHIGRCVAPCTDRVSRSEYLALVAEVRLFLRGRTGELLDELECDMQAAAADHRYEHAARLRDRITAVRKATQRQRVVSEKRVDFDVVTPAVSGTAGLGLISQVREGRLLGREVYTFTLPGAGPGEGGEVGEVDEEILAGLILRHYLRASHIPATVYVPVSLADRDVIAEALGRRQGRRVNLRQARQGAAAAVQELAATDARYRLREMIARREGRDDFVPAGIACLQSDLDLPRPPHLIEAVDVSHIQGSDPVAGLVCFHNGEPVKNRYRRFNLRRACGGDDPAGIAEAVERHYRRLLTGETDDNLPDLLLIDGGRTQLEAAGRVLDSLGIDRLALPVIGLAKRLEEIYLPEVEGPQTLGRKSPALRLLQRIRDEVHRFALGYHRTRRDRRVRVTLLTEVPGVGEAKARALLAEFGSVRRMLQSGVEAIAGVRGIGEVLAARIVDTMGEGDRG